MYVWHSLSDIYFYFILFYFANLTIGKSWRYPFFRPTYHWNSALSRVISHLIQSLYLSKNHLYQNAHLVHQNWYRIRFTHHIFQMHDWLIIGFVLLIQWKFAFGSFSGQIQNSSLKSVPWRQATSYFFAVFNKDYLSYIASRLDIWSGIVLLDLKILSHLHRYYSWHDIVHSMWIVKFRSDPWPHFYSFRSCITFYYIGIYLKIL
jgi:hypothetical protein